MSAAAATVEAPAARVGVDRRAGLLRLVGVELRKMIDTRAGFWLQLGTLGLMVSLVVVNIVIGESEDQAFQDMMWSALWPATVLLPVAGVLLITSEWSQRTSLITFTLVPHRSRVLVAKLGAGIALALTALVLALGLAVVGTVIADPGVDGTWSLPPAMLGQAALYVSATMIMGLAFGSALLSSAPAIVLYFVLPLSWTLLGSIPKIERAAGWLDGARSLSPMIEHTLSTTEWARAGTTMVVWMFLPLLVGAWRIARHEVS
jgi:ABC-2 type transport system permease protein